MKKAEEKAMELYPVKNQHVPTIGGRTAYVDVNEKARNAFLKGVEFANQPKPQAQYSTSQQIKELILIANREGLYDAADFLRKAQQPKVPNSGL